MNPHNAATKVLRDVLAAIDTGRSEPLFIVRDQVHNFLADYDPCPTCHGGDGWRVADGVGPRPNSTTIATVPDLLAWLSSLNRGDWSWILNPRCKYVTIGIDTRSGAHSLGDRDGNDLTLDNLTWQYRRSAAPDAEVL